MPKAEACFLSSAGGRARVTVLAFKKHPLQENVKVISFRFAGQAKVAAQEYYLQDYNSMAHYVKPFLLFVILCHENTRNRTVQIARLMN